MKIYFLFIFILLIFIKQELNGQIITTVAGGATGHGGDWGDGGSATLAEIGLFGELAVDKFGNIYIGDCTPRVRRVDIASGLINTVAGTGLAGYNGDGILATNAKLNAPCVINVDSIGNFYIIDINNYRIRKVNITTGIISTFAGNGVFGFCGDSIMATAANFDYDVIVFDVFENIIFESNHHRICKIDTLGMITTIGGTGMAGNAGDGGPAILATMSPNAYGICTDKFGNIYFSDSFKSVRKINICTGIITKVAGLGNGIGSPYSGDGGLATATIINPVATAIDDTGNLYIADDVNSRILKVDTFGFILTIAGTGVSGYSGDNGQATDAKIANPENVVIDKCGNLYIADFNNKRVRKVTFNPSCELRTTQVQEQQSQEVSLFPNPAINYLNINAGYIINTVAITNIIGQVVLNKDCKTEKVELAIGNLKNGVYFVKVNEKWVGRFLKQ